MAAKKQKRPPKEVWCVVTDDGVVLDVFKKRCDAMSSFAYIMGTRVAGPYVLAERARQK